MVQENKLLITRPSHDIATHYLSRWSKEIIKKAQEKGKKVIDLENEESKAENFRSYMTKQDPEIAIINGHGNSNAIAGHKDEIILNTEDKEEIVSGKKIYARTCKSGKLLGQNCVDNKNAEAYIGYKDDFVLVRDNRTGSHPTDDKLASPILKASNEVPHALIEGKEAKEAYNRSQQKYKEMMKKAVANYELDNGQVFNALAHNRENQVLHN